MEILEAYDLTRCAHSAAQLVGCDHKTVAHYVALRDVGADPTAPVRRPRLIDPFLPKIEELVERSAGKIRADVVHDRLLAMGFAGVERTTRRTVAELKQAWRAGQGRRYRPWIPEPGMWLQFDWGEGPKTVTVEHVAGIPIRHPEIAVVGRHYGCKVETCVAYDPESKGGVEATVRIAKADLVPTTANLLDAYHSFAELQAACERFCERINAREHRETRMVPLVRLAAEREHLHVLPHEPHTLALGCDRLVKKDQTIRWGSVRYSTPPGWRGQRVWCRVVGEEEELVIVGRGVHGGGLEEVWRHRLATPTEPAVLDEHYPHHPNGRSIHAPKPRPRTPEEIAFLSIGEGAHRWLVEAAALGATRARAKTARAVELATALGPDRLDQALGLAATAGRFADDDLPSILDHLATTTRPGDL